MAIEIIEGDCRSVLKELADQSVNCIVTSPPYFGLRDYGVADQMGLEPTPAEFVEALVGVLHEARRVLRDDGTLWLNLGDSYARAGGWADNNGLTLVNGKPSKRGESGRARTNMTGDGSASQKLAPGLKSKDLIGIPWRVAFALQADGWYLRQDIIWHKPNPMPESVRDRCTKAHEYIFLLSKSPTYYFDWQAMQEPAVKGAAGSKFNAGKTAAHQLGRSSDKPRRQDSTNESYVPGATEHSGLHREGSEREPETRNRRSVWTVTTKPFKEAHFATFPPDLIEPCVLAGCPEGGTVLDPFFGAGTTGVVCQRTNRGCIGIELNPEYFDIAARRLGLTEEVAA
jgi:DNA modification methylase